MSVTAADLLIFPCYKFNQFIYCACLQLRTSQSLASSKLDPRLPCFNMPAHLSNKELGFNKYACMASIYELICPIAKKSYKNSSTLVKTALLPPPQQQTPINHHMPSSMLTSPRNFGFLVSFQFLYRDLGLLVVRQSSTKGHNDQSHCILHAPTTNTFLTIGYSPRLSNQ